MQFTLKWKLIKSAKITFKLGNLPLIGPSNVAINVKNSFGFITLAGRLFVDSSAASSSSLSRVTTTAIVIISANKNTALHTMELQKKRNMPQSINLHSKLAELDDLLHSHSQK